MVSACKTSRSFTTWHIGLNILTEKIIPYKYKRKSPRGAWRRKTRALRGLLGADGCSVPFLFVFPTLKIAEYFDGKLGEILLTTCRQQRGQGSVIFSNLVCRVGGHLTLIQDIEDSHYLCGFRGRKGTCNSDTDWRIDELERQNFVKRSLPCHVFSPRNPAKPRSRHHFENSPLKCNTSTMGR